VVEELAEGKSAPGGQLNETGRLERAGWIRTAATGYVSALSDDGLRDADAGGDHDIEPVCEDLQMNADAGRS